MIEIGWSSVVLRLLIGFPFWNPTPGAERSTKAPEDETGQFGG